MQMSESMDSLKHARGANISDKAEMPLLEEFAIAKNVESESMMLFEQMEQTK